MSVSLWKKSSWPVFATLVLFAWADLAIGNEGPISLGEGATATAATLSASDTPCVQSETCPDSTASSEWPPGILQQGLDAIGLGQPMQDLGLRAYGHVQAGMTFKMHGPQPRRQGLLLRGFETKKPGNVRLNQLMFTLDRPVDTDKSFDMGGRVDFLYGTDASQIHQLGMFDSNQLDRDLNYDIPQAYAEMWFKTGPNGQGFNIMFGKWFTTHGAEVTSAPDNYLYSRSLLYVFAQPLTHTGLRVAYNLDSLNSIYFAVVRGWDQFKDANSMPTWMAGFTLSGTEEMGDDPRSQLAFNFMIGPEQAGRWVGENRLLLDVVWTWRWTESLTQVMNFDWGWEDDVPGALNRENVARRADAAWYGLSYTLNYIINDYVNTTGRFDWFTDNAGVRTGYRGTFFETTAGLSITPFPKDPILRNLMIRPEIRADWSSNNAPFADKCQWTGAFDIIYKF